MSAQRFKEEKLADFKRIAMDFVELQIEHNRKVEEAWSKLLPDLEAIGSSGTTSEKTRNSGVEATASESDATANV